MKAIFADDMKKLVLVILSLAVVNFVFAQKTFWEKPDYGLNFNVNLPVIKPVSSDTLSMKTEWGTSIFFEFGNKKKWAFQSSLGFDRIKYNHNFLHRTFLSNNITMGFTAFYSHTAMQGTRFFAGIEPTFSVGTKEESLDGTKGGGITAVRSTFDQPFDLALQAGISLQFRKHLAFNIAYKELVMSSPLSHRYDGIPDQIQVSVQIKFNQIQSLTKVDTRSIASNHIKALKDSSFLLVVLESYNREFTKAEDEEERIALRKKINEAREIQLKALTNLYQFSKLVVCYDSVFPEVLKGNFDGNIDFVSTELKGQDLSDMNFYVARIGHFVLDGNQSERSGVFVYDRNMNLLSPPFPHFTSYPGLEYYLNDSRKFQNMIFRFNDRLNLYYQSVIPAE